MAPSTNICYYGLHFGCLNMEDPGCRICGDRLVDGVVQVLHPTTSKGASKGSGSTVYQDDAIRKHASRLAEAVAKRLSEQKRLKMTGGMTHATSRIVSACLCHCMKKEGR